MSGSRPTGVKRVVLLMGPTAAGKTDVALELAAELPCEIVSVDSALVYRGMDIGTGKPSPAERARVPHHLIDILDPRDAYSAGQFVRDARRCIDDILGRGRLPVLVGGTMLYFRALTRGLAELPAADATVRARLDERAAGKGWPALYAELQLLDPVIAARLNPNDAQRIQRALEVIELTGVPLSELQRRSTPVLQGMEFLRCAWNPSDRETLYQRIEARFDRMLAAGFAAEVAALFARGDLDPTLSSMRAVGYRQMWAHLAGECDLSEARRRAVLATRHLARRQLIWLRAEPQIEWFDSLQTNARGTLKTRIHDFFAAGDR